jgi:predicted acyl esterase
MKHIFLSALLLATPAMAQQASETPAEFKPSTQSFDYQRSDVMIPMRDGVKLHTVIRRQKRPHPAHPHALRCHGPYHLQP